MCRTVGIDPLPGSVTFPTRGNMGPVTIPFTRRAGTGSRTVSGCSPRSMLLE